MYHAAFLFWCRCDKINLCKFYYGAARIEAVAKGPKTALSTQICHPRENGDPFLILDSRLRGNDK